MNGHMAGPYQHRPVGPLGPQQGPQSNIVCAHCSTLLLYPQGASNVRCARCGDITAVPLHGGNEAAQLVCNNSTCRVVLMYPRGASQVQCSLCGTINCAMAANQVGHLVCSCCRITLMYAHGAASVKCAVCNTVTPVSAEGGGQGSRQQGGPQTTGHKPNKTVVIVNPSAVDEDGNEVPDFVVGVASNDGPPAASQHGIRQ
eukprot:jgi/Astpho2/682/Aster-04514